MAGSDTSTGLNVFSLILSIACFVFMVALTLFPLTMMCRDQNKLAAIHHNRHELNKFMDKLTYNYMSGLKFTKLSRLYQFVFMTRRLILAIILIAASDKAVQLIVFII